MVAPSGAGGLLALLEEQEPSLQAAAVRGLLKVVDTQWAEVSAHVSRVEAFAEDAGHPQQAAAALLAAKARPRRAALAGGGAGGRSTRARRGA